MQQPFLLIQGPLNLRSLSTAEKEKERGVQVPSVIMKRISSNFGRWHNSFREGSRYNGNERVATWSIHNVNNNKDNSERQ